MLNEQVYRLAGSAGTAQLMAEPDVADFHTGHGRLDAHVGGNSLGFGLLAGSNGENHRIAMAGFQPGSQAGGIVKGSDAHVIPKPGLPGIMAGPVQGIGIGNRLNRGQADPMAAQGFRAKRCGGCQGSGLADEVTCYACSRTLNVVHFPPYESGSTHCCKPCALIEEADDAILDLKQTAPLSVFHKLDRLGEILEAFHKECTESE